MYYTNRPRIKIKKTLVDNIIEIIGWVILFAMWGATFINYSKIPDIIPIHYNSYGQVDGYGDKSMIWYLLIISSLLYIGLLLLSKVPHIYNYPVKITEENALMQYTYAIKIFRYINLIFISIFCHIVFKTIIT